MRDQKSSALIQCRRRIEVSMYDWGFIEISDHSWFDKTQEGVAPPVGFPKESGIH